MQRTFNYTDRSRIGRNQARFSFCDSDLASSSFDVVFDIDARQYPANARLYIEAYYKETRQRFDFGTVANITPPKNRTLDQIDMSGPTLFRVLLVDEVGKHGKLLAKGEQFRADENEDDNNKSSILPVKKYDLGQLPWKVHFESDCAPELCVNKRIENGIERLRTDPVFQSLVLPAALREILVHYLWDDTEPDGDESCQRWMAFSSMFAEERPNTEDPSELFAWVEEVVAGFSERFHLADMLVNACEGDES